MTDDLTSYRNKRFVVAPSYISRDLLTVYGHIVVLTDFQYWHDKSDELLEWCKETGSELKGVTVDIPNDETLTLFCLRWS